MRVAPREIVDVVYRAARVAGVSAGTANELAEASLFAEVHLGAGLGVACDSVCENPMNRGPIEAYLALLAAEGELADEPVTVLMPPGTTTATIARQVDALARRGITATHGSGIIDTVTLSAGTAGAERYDNEPMETALATGIEVDDTLWACLEETAAAYLVAEALLDAAD